MADPASAAISGGFDLLGSGVQAYGAGRENKRQAAAGAQSASTINDAIQNFILPTDTTGLEANAVRTLTENQGVLDAGLAKRGIYNSGTANRAHQELASSAMGDLAEAINADQFARGSTALQGYSSPAFGFLDANSGQPTNQGK